MMYKCTDAVIILKVKILTCIINIKKHPNVSTVWSLNEIFFSPQKVCKHLESQFSMIIFFWLLIILEITFLAVIRFIFRIL